MTQYLLNQYIYRTRYRRIKTALMMAALSRVLEEAWKLGLMSAEDYHRAIASSTAVGNRH
ncbi:hypothetical protein [Chlorogloea sp. CCALA 695]|uniref:hypothetical protein n=1 Tax=Chlorogloea sp. CCALA 695 TaxID=2107693 RepID=UPI0011B2545B|nr:hypothetical protein [Chlorogloea sp. CCALA 695]